MNNIILKETNLKKHIDEINKYLNLLNIDNVEITLQIVDFPKAKNDAYSIKFKNPVGEIKGNNTYALLSGIYRFFEECGVRFLRPNPHGEFIPKIDKIPDMDIYSEASFYHRGTCIEGAVGEKHVLNMIDWEAKVGMNSYFTQFRQSHTFFDRYYTHTFNPNETPSQISMEETDNFIREIIKELKDRGMIYQAVGHGWTSEPFGYKTMGWEQLEEISEDYRQHLALIDGERKLWHKVPLNTNLCYSNPETRKIIVNDILKYLSENPNIDILHLWLADSYNNHCTCPECLKMIPSDFYVIMLNELDEALTKAGINTKIVFLIYYELLWAPEHNKLINQDRFILMFAPITRTWLNSWDEAGEPKEPRAFVRNNIAVPQTDEEFLGLYYKWREIFKGDSFNFDYYLMWFYVKDPGFIHLSRLINRDIKCYDKLLLNGLISCQIQRVFMPISLPMYTMAKTLWQKDLSYEEIEEDYFKSAFGERGDIAKEYCHKVSELFNPKYLVPKVDTSKEALNSLLNALLYIESKEEIMDEIFKETEEPTQKFSWELLIAYKKLTKAFLNLVISFIKNNPDKIKESYKVLREISNELDSRYNIWFDGWGFINVMIGLFWDYINNFTGELR